MFNITNKIIKKITVAKLNLAMLTILTGFVLYVLFAPIVPAVYDKPMIQNQSAVYAGHTLTYKIHACRNVDEAVVTTITRQLVSVTNKQLQPINLSTDIITNKAGCSTNTKTLLIPYLAPEGSYRLIIRGSYQVVPIRKSIVVSTQSEPFTIHANSVDQEVQDLIEANRVLQEQLTSQTSINSSQADIIRNNNTTIENNKTTTTPPANNSNNQPSTNNETALQAILKALGGGIPFQL
jgi:hypothetical protein